MADKPCIFVSLDTSSSVTGVCVWENGVRKESCVIDLRTFPSGEERLNEMCRNIYSVLKKHKPSIVVCEMTVVERSAHTQRMLSEIVGVVRGYCLSQKDVWFDRLRPAEWRKMVWESHPEIGKPPRKREELKQWSISAVKSLFGIDTDDNEADAILIGLAYKARYEK